MASNSSPLAPDAPERFDFGQAGHISADQLRTLRSLDEQFARSMTHTLSAWLRTNLTVTPTSNEQKPFHVFAENMGTDYVVPLQLVEHHVRGALQWSMRLVPEVVDLLLGGSGGVPELNRELTEIEETVLLSVLEIVVRELNNAWSHIGLTFAMEERDRDGQQNRLMAAGEKTFCMRYEIAIPGALGELNLCFPISAINTSLRAFAAVRDVKRPRPPEERARMEAALGNARVQAGLCFPPVRIAASTLQQLRPGSLLRLPLSQHAAAELRLSDTVVCPATAVRTADRRAARVTSMPMETPATASTNVAMTTATNVTLGGGHHA